MATENLTDTLPALAASSAAEALHGHASEIYNVLALLDALGTISDDDGKVNPDTVTRIACMAHRDLLAITERLFEVSEGLKTGLGDIR
jgi:hypothetical protein